MFKAKATYKDLFSGDDKPMVFRGEPLSLEQRWFVRGNYHKVGIEAEEKCSSCRCHHFKWNADKCAKVGITEVSASNIKADYVCSFFKPKIDQRGTK